jgi:long-chain acyl-CoA synthetase
MQTLLDVLAEIRRLGSREALRFYNGFRTTKLTYGELYGRIGACAAHFDRAGLRKGDRILIWGENRPEWVSVFWAAIARGIEVVPVDFHSSPELVRRIQTQVCARLLVVGDAVDAGSLDSPRLSFGEIQALPANEGFACSTILPDDVVEIVYTSGTTGEPIGVVHRHKNICANLTPIQTEMRKYERLARPFQPVRILDLLPLSHLFGQSLGVLIPPLLGGAAVFMLELSAGPIIETIRRERVSVLVSVPKLLSNLEHEVERKFHPSAVIPKLTGIPGIIERWWRFRRIHRAVGFKFWAFIVGGAEVSAPVESFWARLGFLVIQGYGLTEASPVVALNHPFNARSGSIGKPIAGQEVKIAPDGEILVRGASVITEFLGAGGRAGEVVEDGWLHTGDIGELDAEGRLYYKGRKKEIIVTAEGLNVYPQDVEAALNSLPQVKDSTVVAARRNGEEQVHAALILRDTSRDPAELVAEANRRLESHQRIGSWSVWPDEDFPRTPSTMKVKRGEVARRIAQGGQRPASQPIESILARLRAHGTQSGEELGISSLERVELLSELESQYGVELDENRFAEISTESELRNWLREAEEGPQTKGAGLPRWTRNPLMRALRWVALEAAVLPAFRMLATVEAGGVENLAGLQPPVLIAANHQSYLDTIAILAALPRRWRHRVAPAMSQDFFRAWFERRGHTFMDKVKSGLQYYLISALVNAYPLPQRMAGVRRALKYTGELVDEDYCPLVFPEGAHTADGKLQPFKTGIGLMAVRLGVPVVPVHLKGMFDIYSIHHEWPQPGVVKVTIGAPLDLSQEHNEERATRAVEEAITRMDAVHFTS